MRGLIAACAAAAMMLSGPAFGAVMVIGAGPAYSCYDAALNDRGDLRSLHDCDAALEDGALARRDVIATHINRGIVYMNRRDTQSALEDFNTAIAMNPAAGEAYINQGAALILLGRAQDAVVSLTRGIELNAQELHKAHFNRALAYEELGDMRAAYEDYMRAQQLSPEWDMPRRELTRFQVRRAGS